MVQPERSTRAIRRPTPGAPVSRTKAPLPGSQSPKSVTHEQVSISLIDIATELCNHVPATTRPQVELLRRLALENKPDQQAKIKEQMLAVAGADALRAAVSALCRMGRSNTPSPPPPPLPATAPPAPAWKGGAGAEPPMPPNLPAIFGSTASTQPELDVFKSELLHAFHCTASTCPISGCPNLGTKLQRLRQHVQQCPDAPNGCLLCSIFGYLRNFHPPGHTGEDGEEADGQCNRCGPPGMAARGGSAASELPAKRARTDGAYGASYPGLLQGVLQQSPWYAAQMGGLAPPMPRVPNAAGARTSSAAPPALPLPESLAFARMTSEMYGQVDNRFGRRGKRGLGELPMLPHSASGGLGGMLPIGLEASKSGLNASGMSLGGISLGEMLRSTSLSELGLGGSFSDLGAVAGLSFQKAASELREANVSELSLSGILGDNASEIIAGLGGGVEAHSAGMIPQSPSQTHRRHDQLLEIMSDFNGPVSNQSVPSLA